MKFHSKYCVIKKGEGFVVFVFSLLKEGNRESGESKLGVMLLTFCQSLHRCSFYSSSLLLFSIGK